MKDFVVYTVLTGGYDNILQPLVVDDRFDFILFSNDFDDKKKVYGQSDQFQKSLSMI